jgi:hypothetical protein
MRLSPFKFTHADIQQMVAGLPKFNAPPAPSSLRRLAAPIAPPFVCDWLALSLWQDRDTAEIWVHAAGGIASVSIWYGPGTADLLVKRDNSPQEPSP